MHVGCTEEIDRRVRNFFYGVQHLKSIELILLHEIKFVNLRRKDGWAYVIQPYEIGIL